MVNIVCGVLYQQLSSTTKITNLYNVLVIVSARTTTCDFQVENCEYFFYVTPSQNPSRTQVTLNANFGKKIILLKKHLILFNV